MILTENERAAVINLTSAILVTDETEPDRVLLEAARRKLGFSHHPDEEFEEAVNPPPKEV